MIQKQEKLTALESKNLQLALHKEKSWVLGQKKYALIKQRSKLSKPKVKSSKVCKMVQNNLNPKCKSKLHYNSNHSSKNYSHNSSSSNNNKLNSKKCSSQCNSPKKNLIQYQRNLLSKRKGKNQRSWIRKKKVLKKDQ